uniref:Putative secreted protein n=1 Tax=Anopheles darlingi TaxID=43151 RepID=A0A2M4DMP3_ANODA
MCIQIRPMIILCLIRHITPLPIPVNSQRFILDSNNRIHNTKASNSSSINNSSSNSKQLSHSNINPITFRRDPLSSQSS